MFVVDYVCINCILNLFTTASDKKKEMNERQKNIWQQEETLIGDRESLTYKGGSP